MLLAPTTLVLFNSYQRAYDMLRFLRATILTTLVASVVTSVSGSVLAKKNLEARQDPQNIVYVTDANTFW